MSDKADEFRRELEVFRTESDAAVQFMYSWQAINVLASRDRKIHAALNETALFWNTALGSLQTSTFVLLGRMFDPDISNHSVAKVLTIGHRHLDIFTKQALAERKRRDSPNADEWLPAYLADGHEATNDDFRRLKGYVQQRRKIYEANYKPIRHQVIAHRSATDEAKISTLWGNTNLHEMENMLVFLRRLHEALWQLFFNGMKPMLRPARYSVTRMLDKPSPSLRGGPLQERLVQQAQEVLRVLARPRDVGTT